MRRRNGRDNACAERGKIQHIKRGIQMDNFKKYENNPVLGNPELGTCFDIYVTRRNGRYRMDFSWRPKKSLAVTFSDDGINWESPQITLEYNEDSGWEDNINRNCVIEHNGKYMMWYTGQARGHSFIGYAESADGIHFNRVMNEPVMISEYPWEGFSVMNPCVIYDEERFKMWYAAGGWVTVSQTEVGYPTHMGQGGIADDVQAVYIPKLYIYNDELDVDLTNLYVLDDIGENDTYNEHNFGIMDYNFLPKDSVVSMAQLTKYCANAEYIGRYPINDNSHVYVYTKLNKTFAVIWSTGDMHKYSLAFCTASEKFNIEQKGVFKSPDKINKASRAACLILNFTAVYSA